MREGSRCLREYNLAKNSLIRTPKIMRPHVQLMIPTTRTLLLRTFPHKLPHAIRLRALAITRKYKMDWQKGRRSPRGLVSAKPFVHANCWETVEHGSHSEALCTSCTEPTWNFRSSCSETDHPCSETDHDEARLSALKKDFSMFLTTAGWC